MSEAENCRTVRTAASGGGAGVLAPASDLEGLPGRQAVANSYYRLSERLKTTFRSNPFVLLDVWTEDLRTKVADMHPPDGGEGKPLACTHYGPKRI